MCFGHLHYVSTHVAITLVEGKIAFDVRHLLKLLGFPPHFFCAIYGKCSVCVKIGRDYLIITYYILSGLADVSHCAAKWLMQQLMQLIRLVPD